MASALTNLLLLALVAGSVLLWYRRKAGAALVYAVTILLVLIAVFPIPQLLLWPLEHRFPRFDQTERADVSGIVLLGGAAISASRTELMGHPVPGNAAHRVQAFLSLAQDHPEARLLVTGGGDNSRPAFREASLIRGYLIERGVDPERIAVEAESRNTFENATFSRDIARPEPNQTWLLVTTARHTPRAVASFRSAGWNVTAVPTGPLLSELPWSITDVDLRGAVEIIGLALYEYLGLLAYRMQGRTGTMWP
jgi:uncharacterized SAM-binding protein YcdF (DUF218 family)